MTARYLFLDINGVLAHDAWLRRHPAALNADRAAHGALFAMVDPACVARIDAICRAVGAEVVVSSTWRKELANTAEALRARGLTTPIVGATPELGGARGHEIAAWLNDHGATADQAVIIDDNDDMGPVMRRLVRTNGRVGVTDADVERAIALF